MPKPVDLSGRIFGRLTVLRRVENTIRGQCRWFCLCECGNETVVITTYLQSGHTRSCGCLRNEDIRRRATTHGATRHGQETPEYRAWTYMITRTTNPRIISAKYYRNVTVCEKWRTSFSAFLSDLGPKPSPRHSLDRFPDPWGSYEPGNVRWATLVEQANNKRTSKMLTYKGKTQTVAEWAREIGVSPYTLYDRARQGWTDAEVLTLPPLPAGQYRRPRKRKK